MTDIFKSVNTIFQSQVGNDSDDESSVVSQSNKTENEVERVKNLVSEETFRVRFGRMLVFLTLLGTGTVVCVLVYAVLLFQNESEIADEFHTITKLMQQDLTDHVLGLFEANKELSNIITVESLKDNETFPYVAVDYFEGYANDILARSNTDKVVYGPLTTDAAGWQPFSVANDDWIEESLTIFAELDPDSNLPVGASVEPNNGVIKMKGPDGTFVPSMSVDGTFLPLLHYSPPLIELGSFQNFDLYSEEEVRSTAEAAAQSKETAFTPFTSLLSELLESQDDSKRVWSLSVYPVHKTFAQDIVTGFLLMSVEWGRFFDNLLPTDVDNVRVFVNNTCGQSAAFDIVNGKAVFKAHEVNYKAADYYRPLELKTTIHITPDYQEEASRESVGGQCTPFLEVRPLKEFPEGYGSNFRYAMTLSIAASFALMGLVFYAFDKQTQLQDAKMVQYAAQSNQVLASLFPANVRDRMFNNSPDDSNMKDEDAGGFATPNHDGNSTTGGSSADMENVIADLYPETTILFADIAGFTAWSSMQEPKQVFILLETIFKAFDEIAKRRRVFKVETVGDCYVAAVGLPSRRREHAVVMCRFARDCMYAMWRLSKELEVTLGPESGHLAMRMGIHSGPVTAGILRGDRARFQLFGDTMNTASRIESTGRANCIHISSETAGLLLESGKSEWIKPREDVVKAKGKGELKTFWLVLDASVDSNGGASSEMDTSFTGDSVSEQMNELGETGKTKEEQARDERYKRLIDWNVDMLTRLLRQLARQRPASHAERNVEKLSLLPKSGTSTIDEVKEIIYLGATSASNQTESRDLDPEAISQLRYYVTSVCAMYRDNPFHNFEHASHVVMSVTKLLARIAQDKADDAKKDLRHPLTQFACAFSALIHDLDHPGVPNARLVEEDADLARFYNNKAIAEQNSLELAFGLLMDKQFEALRKAIYTNESEMKIFRELVINSIMATDIVDKDLKALRNARWEKAFSEDAHEEAHPKDDIHRKATIVIEHLIQASDVAHTMQHWMVYRRWNERFFEECYKAYKEGRAKTDPSENWYKGEIGFFDFYIIPLARKLKECGVFGVSSDEYLDYAQKNRDEWERQGQACVAAMVEKVRSKF